jgi:hypothetical protein
MSATFANGSERRVVKKRERLRSLDDELRPTHL